MAESIPTMTPAELKAALRAETLRQGFAAVGFTSAEPLGGLVQRRWQRWLVRDVAGQMHYLRRLEPRRTHPCDLLPEAQTVLVAWAAYSRESHPPPPKDEGAYGKIARYAWGRDYHQELKARLNALGAWLANQQLGITWRSCVDSAPLDERALAERAGLGFYGKNTLLINSELGSTGLLAVMLLSCKLPPDTPMQRTAQQSCGNCRQCIDACPTEALMGPWQFDPRRCISYLTIEHRGPFPPELESRRAGWAFGCDICQEVCPFNGGPGPEPIKAFKSGEGMGCYLTEKKLLKIPSEKGLWRVWGHTPLTRPRRAGLWRNLESARGAGSINK